MRRDVKQIEKKEMKAEDAGVASLCELWEALRPSYAQRWNGEEPAPLVVGEGCAKEPALMLVGEAPGGEEALQGRPFVGKAGKNLDSFLSVLGVERADVYITNVVKIRPSRRSAAGRIVNRPPTREETAFFTPWLRREMLLVKPKALITLGNVAMHAFLPKEAAIGECHGRWHNVCLKERNAEMAVPMFALYHPAAVIYRTALKETYQQDLETLRDSLAGISGQEE